MKSKDPQMKDLEKRFGPGMKELASRPDLLGYVEAEASITGIPSPNIYVLVMIMTDMAYHPSYPNNIRMTGLTPKQLDDAKRSVRICNKLREIFPERPGLIEVLEYMRDHDGISSFI